MNTLSLSNARTGMRIFNKFKNSGYYGKIGTVVEIENKLDICIVWDGCYDHKQYYRNKLYLDYFFIINNSSFVDDGLVCKKNK